MSRAEIHIAPRQERTYAVANHNMSIQALKMNKGFTLVEMMIYVSIATILVSLVLLFLVTLRTARVKSETINEVEQQGFQAMHQILYSIRNAEGLNSPAIGTSANSLSLNAIGTINDPTVYDVQSNVLKIREGASAAVSLTNDFVIISDVLFTNVTRSGTRGTIRVQFTITRDNPTGRNEYSYSRTFYGTAGIRQ